MSRWHDKADALTVGWRRVFTGETPPLGGIVLALAVAQHETQCGDAWPTCRNWGACTLRGLNDAEREVLRRASVFPTVANPTATRHAEQIAMGVLTGSGLEIPEAELHCDSAPNIGAYFTWFAAFDDDASGAEYFARVLARQRPQCHALLMTVGSEEHGLAALMYQSHYFLGFHDPHQPGGAEQNVEDYARALRALTPEIHLALIDWVPPSDAPSDEEIAAEADIIATDLEREETGAADDLIDRETLPAPPEK